LALRIPGHEGTENVLGNGFQAGKFN